MYLACDCKDSILIFEQPSSCNCVERTEISSILPFHRDSSHELHEDPSFASTTVHEEVDDLVDVVLLLEHDEVLLAATRSFRFIFCYFFDHNQPGIRVFESPLDSQRGFAPFVGPRES